MTDEVQIALSVCHTPLIGGYGCKNGRAYRNQCGRHATSMESMESMKSVAWHGMESVAWHGMLLHTHG